jgi:flavorubredoxin
MNIAVRYYSKSGRTKAVAQAIAKGAGVEALSITDAPELNEKVDLLFLGGAPYANIMAPQLNEHAKKLGSENVEKAVLFTTSNWSKRTLAALKRILKSNKIEIADETFYAQASKVDSKLSDAEEFGRKFSAR